MRLFIGIVFLFSIQVLASSDEIVLGIFRQSTAERISSGERTPVRPGYGIGAQAQSFELLANTTIKLGLMYEQREASDIFSGVEHNLLLKTLLLKTHISYQATDYLSVFAGPQFSVLLSSNCKPTTGVCLISDDATKYFVPVEAGFDYTFMTHYGAEIFYEYISEEFWDKTFQKAQTFGLNLKYKF